MDEAESKPAVDPVLREVARNAWTFGLLAIILLSLMPCTSYLSLLGAMPLGFIAMSRARQVLDGGVPIDEGTEVYARTGRITGLVAASLSSIFLAMVVAFVLLYAAVVAMVFGLAAAVPPPPPPVPYP